MTVMLIDGTNLLVRACKASERVPLTNAEGVPTAALMIFVNMLSRHIKEERPTHLVVCWDGGKSEHRRAIWDGYKAKRGEAHEEEPDRPVAQAKAFCTLAGLHHVEREGFEADDLIANYWRQARPIDTDIVILSGDKDFQQLIDQHCILVRPMNAGAPADRWDYDRVVTECGVEPRHLPLVKAMMGDVSDGVPGLPRIGPKKAAKRIVAEDGSWLKVFDSFTDEERTLVKRNLMLMDLRNEVPRTPVGQPPEFKPTRPGDLAFQELLEYLEHYGLASVRSRLLHGDLWEVNDGAGDRLEV